MPIAGRLGAIEHGFNPAPRARLAVTRARSAPAPRARAGIALGNCQVPNYRIGLGLEGVFPLLPMLGIATAVTVGSNVGFRHGLERHSGDNRRLLPFLQRINARLDIETKRGRQIAGIGERDTAGPAGPRPMSRDLPLGMNPRARASGKTS